MPLYAGISECNITPPLGVWMSGYAVRSSGATSVHDYLYARALVLDNGARRVVVVAADIIAFPPMCVARIREGIATQLHTTPDAIMLHASHTHGGPNLGIYRCMGEPDRAYRDVFERMVIGAAVMAAQRLQPVHLSYGESPAQIGVNRRQALPFHRVQLGADYAGPVAPAVQTLCVNRANGDLLALLFLHACHPTTMMGENLAFTGDWCGAANERLKRRFREEGECNAIAEEALPFSLQGCCGDINPYWRPGWDAVAAHGKAIADAAHQARWNAQRRLSDSLEAEERMLELPLLPPPSREECDKILAECERESEQDRAAKVPLGRLLFREGQVAWAKDYRVYAEQSPFKETQTFAIQHFSLGGIHLLGFPAEMFVQYQLDFSRQCASPVLSLGYTNGCWNYLPTTAEYARGGYEVNDAFKYYGTLMLAPESETLVREATYSLLGVEEPDTTPYPLLAGPSRPL